MLHLQKFFFLFKHRVFFVCFPHFLALPKRAHIWKKRVDDSFIRRVQNLFWIFLCDFEFLHIKIFFSIFYNFLFIYLHDSFLRWIFLILGHISTQRVLIFSAETAPNIFSSFQEIHCWFHLNWFSPKDSYPARAEWWSQGILALIPASAIQNHWIYKKKKKKKIFQSRKKNSNLRSTSVTSNKSLPSFFLLKVRSKYTLCSKINLFFLILLSVF